MEQKASNLDLSQTSAACSSRVKPGNPTVLVVDDDPVAVSLLEEQIHLAGYPALIANDGAQALRILRQTDVRMVISDWNMPKLSGLELCREIRRSPNLQFIYFIMLTIFNQTDKVVEAFDVGVNDFLSKPCEHLELVSRLHAGRRVIELETSLLRRVQLAAKLNDRLKRLNSRLKEMATTDSLTGLCNRREAMRRLREEWSSADRYGHALTIAMIDINRFKKINDTLGHLEGDKILKLLGQILLQSCRGPDLPARLGGDEFLIILPHTDLSGAAVMLSRISQKLQTQTGGQVSMSFGVAEQRRGITTIEQFLHAADLALYAAKTPQRVKNNS